MRYANAFDVLFGSVCSGIEAASVAFEPLGWKAAWFAEIEPFPSAVLAHHYPAVPNLGDMTTIARRVLTGEVAAPDVLCGGTPCQAFSVAGLRESLSDARGNLTLKFVELADAIDHVRNRAGTLPCVVKWENVPGVLSTKDNAFGCFLAGLAGEDEPLQPPGKRWEDAGAVFGPKRAIAWRTLDAQFFGLAQRRRRVFVVASAREGFDPAQVLLEWDGVRRDSAPSRQAGESAAPCVTAGSANGSAAHGARSGSAKEGLIVPVAFGGNKTSGPRDVASALSGHGGTGRHDFETETFITHAPEVAATMVARSSRGAGQTNSPGHNADEELVVTHSLRGEGFDASEDGTGRGTPLVPVHCRDVAGAITSNYGKQVDNSDTALGPNIIAFDCKASGQSGFGVGEIASTMRAMGHADSHQNGGGHQAVAIAFNMHKSGNEASSLGISVDKTDCLRAFDKSPFAVQPSPAMQVRRLTPEECEALQGFSRHYTRIAWRGKPPEDCPDGPRYKALGNSWAVPVVRWIGARIDAAMRSEQRAAA